MREELKTEENKIDIDKENFLETDKTNDFGNNTNEIDIEKISQ